MKSRDCLFKFGTQILRNLRPRAFYEEIDHLMNPIQSLQSITRPVHLSFCCISRIQNHSNKIKLILFAQILCFSLLFQCNFAFKMLSSLQFCKAWVESHPIEISFRALDNLYGFEVTISLNLRNFNRLFRLK